MTTIISEIAQVRYRQCQSVQNEIQPIIDVNHNQTNTNIVYSFSPTGLVIDSQFSNDLLGTNFFPQDIIDNNISNIRIYNKDRIDYIIYLNDNSDIEKITSTNEQYTCTFRVPELGRTEYNLLSTEFLDYQEMQNKTKRAG